MALAPKSSPPCAMPEPGWRRFFLPTSLFAMTTKTTPSAAENTPAASISTPLAAAQERFLSAILPHAAKKLQNLTLKFLRSSPCAKQHFADLAANAHTQLVHDYHTALQRTCDSVLQIYTHNLQNILKAIEATHETRLVLHRAWQKTLITVAFMALASTGLWSFGRWTGRERDGEIAKLRVTLAVREAELEASSMKLRQHQKLIDWVSLTQKPDGSIWAICENESRVLGTYRLRSPVPQ